MTYRVIVHRRVDKFLDSLDDKMKSRVQEVLRDLADYPLSMKKYEVAKLQGWENTYRIRLGKLRLIFQVDKKAKLILVGDIDRRGAVY